MLPIWVNWIVSTDLTCIHKRVGHSNGFESYLVKTWMTVIILCPDASWDWNSETMSH